jgi:GH25 family lysozyme M1 (1,4-beta-N-acetylmuramidase)
MSAVRANVDFAKRIFADRLGNRYVYGGEWNPNNTDQGCDCSALVAHICNAIIYGTGMQWRRIDPATGGWITTESWRPIEVGQHGPFGTITVASPRDFPADAAVRIALHHGPGGGANSHMNCMVEGTYMESSGSHGCCTNNTGAIPHTSNFWNDFAYLPGPISGDAGPTPPPPQEHATIFGIDISNHQGNMDIAQVKREGFEFLFAKVSEGHNYKDPYWPRNRDLARENSLILAGYHYVTTENANAQAELFVSHLGDKTIPAMLDFEENSGDIANYWRVKNAIEARGVKVALSYIPKWYWQKIGSPDLSTVPGLIQSSYVNGTGYASALYPGDGSDRWAPFGNRQPIILQFTDKASVAGLKVDANAFRGTPDQMREGLGQGSWTPPMNQLVGGNNPMANADDVNRQLDDPNDKVVIYEGSPFAHPGWTIRDWVRTLVWDLTRFQKPGDARFKANPDAVWGLRDAVSSLQRQVNQNNVMLKRLLDQQEIKHDDLD